MVGRCLHLKGGNSSIWAKSLCAWLQHTFLFYFFKGDEEKPTSPVTRRHFWNDSFARLILIQGFKDFRVMEPTRFLNDGVCFQFVNKNAPNKTFSWQCLGGLCSSKYLNYHLKLLGGGSLAGIRLTSDGTSSNDACVTLISSYHSHATWRRIYCLS